MTELERNLLQSLTELEATVQSLLTADPKPSLLPLFARIDELARQLPPDASPELLHYLQKKCYGKARLWLEEREAGTTPGTCRH
jgi:hypothetical protein